MIFAGLRIYLKELHFNNNIQYGLRSSICRYQPLMQSMPIEFHPRSSYIKASKCAAPQLFLSCIREVASLKWCITIVQTSNDWQYEKYFRIHSQSREKLSRSVKERFANIGSWGRWQDWAMEMYIEIQIDQVIKFVRLCCRLILRQH